MVPTLSEVLFAAILFPSGSRTGNVETLHHWDPTSFIDLERAAMRSSLIGQAYRIVFASIAFIGIICPLQALAGPVDLTFFFTADTHYGLDLWNYNEPANKATIDAMNALPGTLYPSSIGGVVGTPSGVLVAGDLTDTPEYINFNGASIPQIGWAVQGFDDDYAVDGSGRIHYPVYEGYGNHDVDNTTHSYTLDGIMARNLVRPGVVHLSDNGLNYSWNWQGVHFINLNIYPGMTDRSAYSLAFLQEDLLHYANTNTPIVLMQHFGFDSFGLGWWTDQERQAFANVIDGYNILGIFHGHLHTTMKYQWNGYDVFNGSAAKDGNFLVVRIHGDQMDVASREDNRWGFTFSKTIAIPEPSPLVYAFALCIIVIVLSNFRKRRTRLF
jgi:cytolysin (calcineurin-like family phosphatase)